jgi:hypothetical protein
MVTIRSNFCIDINMQTYNIKDLAIKTLNKLGALKYDLSTSDRQQEVVEWLKEKDPSDISKYLECENPYLIIARSFLDHKRVQEERYSRYRDSTIKSAIIASKKKEIVYSDINKKETSPYESQKMGKVTYDNINLTEINCYFDTLFAINDNYTYSFQLNNRDQYSLEAKSLPFRIANIKAIESSPFYIPSPTNIGLAGEILKVNIREFQDSACREYPNYNYMFEYQVEAMGARYKLTPLKSKYKLADAFAELTSISLTFWLQNLMLTFPPTQQVATLTYANPMIFTGTHGLLTGDKISIYKFDGTLPNYGGINSTFSITVLTPTTFSIPVNALTGTGPAALRYYILKNKIEGNLTLCSL